MMVKVRATAGGRVRARAAVWGRVRAQVRARGRARAKVRAQGGVRAKAKVWWVQVTAETISTGGMETPQDWSSFSDWALQARERLQHLQHWFWPSGTPPVSAGSICSLCCLAHIKTYREKGRSLEQQSEPGMGTAVCPALPLPTRSCCSPAPPRVQARVTQGSARCCEANGAALGAGSCFPLLGEARLFTAPHQHTAPTAPRCGNAKASPRTRENCRGTTTCWIAAQGRKHSQLYQRECQTTA